MVTVGFSKGDKSWESVELSDTSQRADGWAVASPLAVPPVLSRVQEELASPVVGVFMQNPVALHDVDGGNVTSVEKLAQIGAVIAQLHILASKVGTLEDLHLVVAVILRQR